MNMRKLRANMMLIRLLQIRNNIAQFHIAGKKRSRIETAVQIRIRQTMPAIIHIRHLAAVAQMNGAQIRHLMPAGAIAGNQRQHRDLFANRLAVCAIACQRRQLRQRLEALLHRQTRLFAALTAANVVKITAPLRGNALRCVQILLIKRLNIGGIAAAQLRRSLLILIVSHTYTPKKKYQAGVIIRI